MKKILGLILAVGLMLGALPARAEYPDKAITCIVPFAPGGAADITVRMVADYLSKEIGQPLVIVNKGGGSGIPAYRRLRRQGIPFAAGILQEHDLDFPAAKALAVDVISSPAFQPMGEGAYTQALAVLKTCETVLCCCPGFGPDNDANRRLLNAAQETGKPVAFSEGGSHGL